MIQVKNLPRHLLVFLSLSSLLSAKDLVRYDFESADNLERLVAKVEKDSCRVEWDATLAHSGQKSLRIKATSERRLRATVLWPDILQTEGFDEGFISFWFYDRFLVQADGTSTRLGWSLAGNSDEGGNGIYVGQASGGASMEWVVDKKCYEVKRHGGWTKFDITFDAEHVSVYIDGVKVQTLPLTNYHPRSLAFFATWGSGLGDIIIDDLVVNDDLAEFHPAAVHAVRSANGSDTAWLEAGAPLELNLSLNPDGAADRTGTVQVELYNLGEEKVTELEVPIDWSRVQQNQLKVAIPSSSLQGSRHYWVLASYRDAKLKDASVRCYQKIDVQYSTDLSALKSFRDEIEFIDSWDFLPGERDAMHQIPSDWSEADQILDFWNTEYVRNRQYKDVSIGWYRREVSIPRSWDGRQILLEVRLPHNAATVFVNGMEQGSLVWPGGKLALGQEAQAGRTVELVLRVDTQALSDMRKALQATESYKENTFRPYRLSGLSGPVSLLAEPTGAKVESVLLFPKVADKSLELQLSTSGIPEGQSMQLEAVISKSGEPLKRIQASVTNNRATASLSWPEVELWDIGKPNLYDVEVTLRNRGRTVDRLPPQRFGFREANFDGRLIKINGHPISFEGPNNISQAGCFGFAEAMTRIHANWLGSNFYSSYRHGSGGTPNKFFENYLDLADEAGYGSYVYLAAPVLTMNLTKAYDAEGKDFLKDTIFWPAYQRLLKQFTALHGNRPGYLFPVGGGTLQVFKGRNPARIGDVWIHDYQGRELMQKAVAVEMKVNEYIRAADPSRASVITGKLTTNYTTDYQGFRPIQELIESNEYWVKNGTNPMLFNENASPIIFDWGSGARYGHGGHDVAYPMVAEYAAETKGDRAFHRQAVDHKVYAQLGQPRKGLFDYLYPYEAEPDAPSVFNEVNYERAREIWLNFRADGLGVHTPWMARCTGADRAQEVWSPVTGYIAGPPARRTDKTHILRPGENWERQFLILNSKREEVQVECRWTATLNGQTIASGTTPAKAGPGDQASVPIMVPMPQVEADATGTLTATLFENGTECARDAMEFQIVVAKAAPKLSAQVALIDPLGHTASELDRSNIPYQRLHFNTDLSDYKVVVIGREAFSYEQKMLDGPFDISALLQAGKRVLVMEQTADVLKERFNFRTEDVPPRHLFARVGQHPITADVPDHLLAYWRGASTLLDGYIDLLTANLRPAHEEHVRKVLWHDGKEHNRHFRWGNHHSLATIFIHKPERGNFRSLVDCGVNLDYSALLEFEQGPGKLLFCQVDLSGRTEADPVAERLLSNMISYLDHASAPTWSSNAAYLGGPLGEDILVQLKANYRRIHSPDEARANEVLILGDELNANILSAWKDPIQTFVQNGGSCFSFPRHPGELTWLPGQIGLEETWVDATLVDKPTRPILAGMSNSELYYTAPVKLFTVTNLPENAFATAPATLAEIPDGKGRTLLCQVWPHSIDDSEKFYMRNDRRDSIRVIQVLLNNLGVPMQAPRGLRDSDLTKQQLQAPRKNLDLSRLQTWQGLKTDNQDASTPSPTDARWAPVQVPGYIGEQRAEWQDDGYFLFWYRLEFEFDGSADAAMLYIGAIDDEDDAYLNGTKIGHTGRDTNIDDWLDAPRRYEIPAGLLNQGKNELRIKVRNLGSEHCGISAQPVRIEWTEPVATQQQNNPAIELAFLPPVDLSGHRWKKLAMETLDASNTAPPRSDPRWSTHRGYLPAATTDIANSTVWYDGYFDLKNVPAGARPSLMIAKIDDEDTIFINGKEIGHTGKDSNPDNFWSAPRNYNFPANLLTAGRNQIIIKTNNLDGAGQIEGPLKLVWMPEQEASRLRLSNLPYIHSLDGKIDDDYWWCGGW
ncbi:hypothetical protein SH580_01280 [Coraliomargarita algicola]|uniref:Glycoside hydrolase family 2 immunoglobulin-like beta-sandwich domain-containing protein n=1 Tax=Coraliomargarita algicola TaxID=3092156 RepID=A0ABZ0RLL9_9BACT|nr:hypothetical protein [Coraliomargarita sp. J2-16]WPJ96333.1 hypothetical protein SH580_01280 [Coraliomargarita sp. J2-16]